MGQNRITDGAGNAVTLERVKEFYAFLQGGDIGGITNLGRSRPRLSSNTAFTVIYVLQEHLDLIPDRFEQCSRCGDLFDAEQEGASGRCDPCAL